MLLFLLIYKIHIIIQTNIIQTRSRFADYYSNQFLYRKTGNYLVMKICAKTLWCKPEDIVLLSWGFSQFIADFCKTMFAEPVTPAKILRRQRQCWSRIDRHYAPACLLKKPAELFAGWIPLAGSHAVIEPVKAPGSIGRIEACSLMHKELAVFHLRAQMT